MRTMVSRLGRTLASLRRSARGPIRGGAAAASRATPSLGAVPLGLLALALAACSSSSTGTGGAGSTALEVRFITPGDGQVFEAPQGAVDIPAVLAVSVPPEIGQQPTVEMLLDGVRAGLLEGGAADFTYSLVTAGLHRLEARILVEGKPATAPGASDVVRIFVSIPCTKDADCDDDNPCSLDACGDSGWCDYQLNDAPDCALPQDDGGGKLPSGILCKDDSDCYDVFGDPNPCKHGVCNVAAQVCEPWQADDGASCDDGDPCTLGDACQAGACIPGAPPQCDDGNPCTDDTCDPAAGGCTNTPNAAACDDGNPCTGGDHCEGGACVAGAEDPCDDGNACTDDTCDPAAGCAHGLITLDCDDQNPCTDDACDPATGNCANLPNDAACDDGDACTSDDACEGGSCAPGTAIDCDDANPCTADSCDPGTGCVHAAQDGPCDDGDPCSSGDACIEGACTPQSVVSCDDGNPCTNETCDAVTGDCIYQTQDTACDDGNPCTEDACDLTQGCLHTNVSDGTPCDDGSPCTLGDQCLEGSCEPGSLVPGCVEDQPVCFLSGSAGDTVSCWLRIARAAQSDPPAVALQFGLIFPPDQADFAGFWDQVCYPDPVGCLEVRADGPTAQPLSTGHSATTQVKNPDGDAASVFAVLVNVADPTSALSDAWFDSQWTLHGDPVFLEARFTLLADIASDDATPLTLKGVVAAQANSLELAVSIVDEIMVTFPKQ